MQHAMHAKRRKIMRQSSGFSPNESGTIQEKDMKEIQSININKFCEMVKW